MQTILVCDDDKEIVEAIEIYLQQEGFHVLKAYDGEEALEILKNNEVHLLIMDVMMPKLDGIRATLKIRENSSIPIIILSAKTEDSDKILGLNIGADDYVEKPFNPLELAVFTFCSTISMEFMPESTQVTSGWLYSHFSASSAGVRCCSSLRNNSFAGSGSRFTRRPPRNGSIMMTGSPFRFA